jgi:hypothetical protein
MVTLPCVRAFSPWNGESFSLSFAPYGDLAVLGLLRVSILVFAFGAAAVSALHSCRRRCATSPDALRLSVPRLLSVWSSGLWWWLAAMSLLAFSRADVWISRLPCLPLCLAAPLILMLCIFRCPMAGFLGCAVAVWVFGWVSAVCLLSMFLHSLLCLAAPLPRTYVLRCPIVVFEVRLLVRASGSCGMRWFGCGGPWAGLVWWLVRGVALSGFAVA